jgi:hypothetical protein
MEQVTRSTETITLKRFPVLSLDWSDAVLAALVALLGLGLYLRTLATFVLPHDSGELQVLVHQLGTAHTTGYSTYLMLGNLFTRLVPVGDIAYRVNLFSAVMGAVTLALAYLAARLLSGSRCAAVFAALALAVGFTFWSQAIIAEVYTTGSAFLAGALVLTIVWYLTGMRRAILAAGLLGGAGLGAHGSLAIFGVGVLFFLLLNWRRRGEWLAPGLIGAVLGLALFVGATFLIDANHAPANIFHVTYSPNHSALALTQEDLSNPCTRVWFVISAGNWRSAMFAQPLYDTPRWLLEYLRQLPRDIFYPTLALAVFGLLRLHRRDKRLAALLWVNMLLQLIFYFNYDMGRARFVFYISSYILWALMAAIGLAELLRIISRQPWGGRGMQVVIALLIAAGCLVPLLWPQRSAIFKGDVAFANLQDSLVQSDTAGLGEEARLTTAALPDNAIVFATWSKLWPYYYTSHIEQGKIGVQFINIYPYSHTAGMASSVFEFIDENIERRPIYLAHQFPELLNVGYTLHAVRMGPTQMWQLQGERYK